MSKISYSLKSIRSILKSEKPSSVCLVTSTKLSQKLAWAIREISIPHSNIILLPDGEKAKEWSELQKLLQKFSVLNLDRKSMVIVVGGGSIGDIVGFASSIYLRGLRYIQVPTTLLAQVDSAHGGKTGINFLNYKNQVGTFHLPIAVIADPRFIASLSKDQIVDGLGEIIKAGMIKDPSILSLLKKHTLKSLVGSADLETIIKKSIAIKQHYISADFKDLGLRQILNVGHTLGHAIELKYGISHGKAVIVGMLQEMEMVESLKLIPGRDSGKLIREELVGLLALLGIKLDSSMKADWKAVSHDKKIMGTTIDFPYVEKIGKAKLIKLPIDQFRKAFK